MENPDSISWIAHESIVARMERHTKRLWVLCIIIFVAFVGTNIGWIIYENSYEDVVTTTQEVVQDTGDGDGNITFSGALYGGDYYGEADGEADDH